MLTIKSIFMPNFQYIVNIFQAEQQEVDKIICISDNKRESEKLRDICTYRRGFRPYVKNEIYLNTKD